MFKNNRLNAILVVLALTACGEKPSAPPTLPWVVAQKAQAGSASQMSSFAGEVRARSESALGFRVGGKITQRLADVGTAVKPGTPIARIDARDLQLNSSAALSQVVAAQADVTQAQADYTRYHELYKKNFISAAELDRRKAVLDVARARLDQARAQSNVTNNQGGYAVLSAEQSGVITAVEADVGQVVAPGQTVVRVARDGEKEVLITVPENRLPQVRAAQRIEISLWAEPDKRYSGKVREVSPVADTVTRTYAVRVSVNGADDAMRLGMTATVTMPQVGEQAVVTLPLTAVYQKGEQTAVWIVDAASQTVKLAPVTLGVYREDSVTVLSGVPEGAMVVTAGVHKLTAGQKVRVAANVPGQR